MKDILLYPKDENLRICLPYNYLQKVQFRQPFKYFKASSSDNSEFVVAYHCSNKAKSNEVGRKLRNRKVYRKSRKTKLKKKKIKTIFAMVSTTPQVK